MFSKNAQRELEGLARKAVAAIVGAMLAFTLLSALLIGGIILLLRALTAGLEPFVGDAGALAISGGLCFVLLGIFFWRMLRTPTLKTPEGEGEEESEPQTFRERIELVIKENPLEAALGAFALGVFGEADPKFRAMVLQSGFTFMRQAQNDPEEGEAEPTDPEQGVGSAARPAGPEDA